MNAPTQIIRTQLGSGTAPPRVWSVLMTLFGDLAQEKDIWVSGAAIRFVMGQMGIREDATRVALHRLRKDGWITSEKTGRTSRYALTDWGLAECKLANDRIYGTTSPYEQAFLLIAPGIRQMNLAGYALGSDMIITSEPTENKDILQVSVGSVESLPIWLMSGFIADEICAESQAFEAQLIKLQAELGTLQDLSTADRVVLRLTLIHGWRRLALRAPDLPDYVMPPSWRGAACRLLMHDILAELGDDGLVALEAATENGA